jgi:hypothetical protein
MARSLFIKYIYLQLYFLGHRCIFYTHTMFCILLMSFTCYDQPSYVVRVTVIKHVKNTVQYFFQDIILIFSFHLDLLAFYFERHSLLYIYKRIKLWIKGDPLKTIKTTKSFENSRLSFNKTLLEPTKPK